MPAELVMLLLAQQSIAATGLASFGTPFAGYGRALLAKVRATLPLGLRDYLDALASVFGTAAVPAKNYRPHAGTIDKLTKAAVTRHRVLMRYHTLHSGEVKDREFDPYSVYFDPDGATLPAEKFGVGSCSCPLSAGLSHHADKNCRQEKTRGDSGSPSRRYL